MDPLPEASTHYRTGEEIRPGDRIALAGDPGIVEFVLRPDDPPEVEWFRRQFGRGFMIRTDRCGEIFFCESDEDLELVACGDRTP